MTNPIEEIRTQLHETLVKYMNDPATKEERRSIIKAAIDEWLNDQFAQFGKWTMRGLVAMLFGALVWIYLQSKGIIR